jgi:hypothetical protein
MLSFVVNIIVSIMDEYLKSFVLSALFNWQCSSKVALPATGGTVENRVAAGDKTLDNFITNFRTAIVARLPIG